MGSRFRIVAATLLLTGCGRSLLDQPDELRGGGQSSSADGTVEGPTPSNADAGASTGEDGSVDGPSPSNADAGSSGGADGSGGDASSSNSDAGSSSADGSSDDASSSSSDGGSDEAGRVPVNHRPNDDQCMTPEPPGTCAASLSLVEACLEDSDCVSGTNGRCDETLGIVTCFCSYDMCTQDTDCPAGQTCACHSSPYNDFSNACVPGNCRVDADCGPGGYCSPTITTDPETTWCGSVGGYYCHTPNDLCIDDSDCGGGNDFCVYSSTGGRWECMLVFICS